MNEVEIAITFGVGFAAGIINVVAGGGSMLVIPFLDELEIGVVAANATNRVGVFFQASAGLITYKKSVSIPWRYANILLIPSVLGAILGAWTASILNENSMRKALVFVFAVMGMQLLREMFRNSAEKTKTYSPKQELISPPWWMILAFLGVGFYGGFIQVGVGIVILLVLHFVGKIDLLRANAIKLYIVACYTIFAVAIFAWRNQIAWTEGFLLAFGGIAGAITGAKCATKLSARALKAILTLAVIAATLRFAKVF